MNRPYSPRDFGKMNLTISPPPSQKAISLNKTIHAAMHDLRSPLNVVKPYLDFLKKVDNIEKQEVILNRMKLAIENMEGIINKFVNYSDLVCECLPAADPIRVQELFEQVRKEMKLRYSTVSFEVNFKNNVPRKIFSYPKRYLKTVLNILIENSINYRSPERSLKVNIIASLIDEDLLLEVRDNGMGFPDSFSIEEAFVPFAKNANPNRGTGLGLASLKYIIERNQGEVYGSSSEDGTAYILRFRPYTLNAKNVHKPFIELTKNNKSKEVRGVLRSRYI